MIKWSRELGDVYQLQMGNFRYVVLSSDVAVKVYTHFSIPMPIDGRKSWIRILPLLRPENPVQWHLTLYLEATECCLCLTVLLSSQINLPNQATTGDESGKLFMVS